VLVGTICGENPASIRLMEKAGFSKCAHLKNIGKNSEKFSMSWYIRKRSEYTPLSFSLDPVHICPVVIALRKKF
jgi:hypothetical protein